MSITIEVNNIEYTNLKDISVSINIDALADEFRLTASSSLGKALPFKGGEFCKIYVSGIKVLTGFIDVVTPSYSASSHEIVVFGRSKTSDIVDSYLNSLDLTMPVSLVRCCESVINQIGASISVSSNVTIEDFKKTEDKISPEIGANCFEFLDELARKRQVLIRSDENGNLLITRQEPEKVDAKLQMIIGDNNNNILEADANYDLTERYNKYVVKSMQNTSAIVFTNSVSIPDVVDQKSEVVDVDVRVGRQYVIQSEKSSTNEQAKLRAEWEANLRRTRSRQARVVVQGFKNETGDIWRVNKLITMDDQFLGISGSVLISGVRFNYSQSGGSTTELLISDPKSFINSIEPIKNTNEYAIEFI